mgnify:CR=1 FL=1
MNTVLIADDEPKLAQDLARRLKRCWKDAAIVAVVNLSVDCVYALIDPRIRYARG